MARQPALLKSEDVLDYFLSSKQVQNCTPRTIEYYKANLGVFQKHYPLMKANQFQVTAFLALKSKEVSPSTLHIYWRVLRTFYRWCDSQQLRDNPMDKVPKPRIPHKVIPVFTPDDLNRLLDHCGTTEYLKARNYAILLLMLDTAIRLSEVTAMDLNDIDWTNSTIKIHGKGRKERYVQFSTDTALALKKYLLYHPRELDCVWLSEEGKALKPNAIKLLFQRLKERAGITDVRCSPHTMRHSSACMFLDNGGSIQDLQQLLGHSSLKSTEIYIETVRQKHALSAHTTASPVAHLRRK